MTTQYILDSAGFLIGVMEGLAPQENSTTIPPIYTEGFRPQFVNGAWLNQSAPKVGPIAFQMLFTPAEMIAADELKATDKVLASFWKLIDDPRTDVVDLGLQSVQNAIEYTLTAVKNAGVDVDVPARKAAILSGVLV